MKKDKAVTDKPTKPTTEPATPKEQEKQEVTPLDTPLDEDDILYCDTDDDSDASVPEPFTPIDPKKAKTPDTKEDQAEDAATQEVMDTTDIPELISNEEEDPPTKEFTFKKPMGCRSFPNLLPSGLKIYYAFPETKIHNF